MDGAETNKTTTKSTQSKQFKDFDRYIYLFSKNCELRQRDLIGFKRTQHQSVYDLCARPTDQKGTRFSLSVVLVGWLGCGLSVGLLVGLTSTLILVLPLTWTLTRTLDLSLAL